MRVESSSRWAPVVAAAAVLAVGALAWPYTVDDAFIVARYASRLAHGLGYTMNEGPATDGITGPLWIVPGWIASALGLDPIAAAKAVGLACAAAAAALVVAEVRRRAVGSRAVWTATALLALSATVGVWAVAGLETGAAMLATTVALIAAVRRPEPMGIVLGIAGALLAWLRPEAVPGALVLAAMAVRRNRREGLVALGLVALGLASVAAFRLALFGTALPLSLSAKPADLGNGAGYLARGLVLALGAVGIAPAWVAVGQSRSLRIPAALVITHGASVVLAGGDWMPGFRLLAPVMPAYAWLVGVGVSDLARRPRVGARGAWALAVLACAIPALDLAAGIVGARAAGESREHAGAALVEELRAHAHVIALVDIGFVGYETDLPVVDLAGVTDPSIGQLPGGHADKPVDFALLAQRHVDAIVLHAVVEPRVEDGRLRSLAGAFGVEERLAMDERLGRTFRVSRVIQYAPAYWYVVLVPRDEAAP
ncbi:MAG: hypothetical protein U0234_03985 [Sandaracinus sp.]